MPIPSDDASDDASDARGNAAASRPAGSVRERHLYVDLAKGLAIALVVIGHIVAREIPEGAGWYEVLKFRIYVFHMPLFMFLSGLTYGFTLKAPRSVSDYLADFRKRAGRLAMAYLALGLIIFFGKLAFQTFSHVENPVNGVSSFVQFLLEPGKSFSAFLWYVYVLTIFYAVMPLIYIALKGRLWILLVITILFIFLPSGSLLCWYKIHDFAMFFVAGVLAAKNHQRFLAIIDKTWLLFLIAFGVSLPYVASFLYDEPSYATFVNSAFAIIGVCGLLRQPWASRFTLLKFIGAYTLSIYLFNTIIMGLGKVAFSHTLGWGGPTFILAFFVLMLAGIFVPIFMKRKIFARFPVIDRIT
ncbi:acyltransferase [soil metagenome]